MRTNNLLIIFTVLLVSGMLIIADNIELAYAYTVATFSVGADVDEIIRFGNYLVFTQSAGNTVKNVATSAPTVVVSTVTGITSPINIFEYNDRMYVTGATTLYEVDVTGSGTLFISRSVSTTNSCRNFSHGDLMVNPSNGFFVCASSTSDLYRLIDLDTMTIVYNSPSLNAGPNPCDSPQDITYSNTYGQVLIACGGTTDNLNSYTAGTDTLLHSVSTAGSVANMCEIEASTFTTTNRVIINNCNSQDMAMYSYTSGSGFTLILNKLNTGFAVQTGTQFDSSGRRFIGGDANGNLHGYDEADFTDLFNVYSGVDTVVDMFVVGFGLSYFATSTVNDAVGVFNMVGLDLGSLADVTTDPTGGIDCSIPANANILICRLGGDNNFGGIGNSTGTGLLNIGCNIVFADCTDTNPRTNGLGLLAFIASLFVIVGMFYYAIGKEAFHMPIFIWITIVIALSAFFTIAGWIDPIFLILAIVAVVAMAVPKIINVTRGSTFGGGSTE